ncbi:esterase [Ahniella affigens]|uniref:Esterase n=2 Tax=Ahniella affigens TaxID=2021234 RepID=A0A2P1PYX0_9GAMM|nr:esterase [Ahniella affigens]
MNWPTPERMPGVPNVSIGSIKRLDGLTFHAIDPRPVDVWLPAGYPANAPYDVLYMHDGQMLFDAAETWNHQEWMVDEIAGALQQAGDVQPFIVVGIHNRSADRHAEYQPQRAFARLSDADKAAQLAQRRTLLDPLYRGDVRSDRYLQWLVEELKPVIDRDFRVSPLMSDTAIMGSSMGGLISWYALERYPTVFGAAACLSTHWPGGFPDGDNTLDDALLAEFEAGLPEPGTHRFWFDHGTETLDQHYPELQQRADQILKAKGYTDADWQTRVYPGADHSEQAWASRLADPLRFLFAKPQS